MPADANISDIQFLKGVGPKRALLLSSELGVKSASELIRIYPFRYVDRSTVTPIAAIRSTAALVQLRAQVVNATLLDKNGVAVVPSDGVVKFNTVHRLSVMVADESGIIELVFFKGIRYIWQKLRPGKVFIFFGKPSLYNGRFNMVHPEIDEPGGGTIQTSSSMTGIYPSTEKLRNAGVTAKVMGRIMASALEVCLPSVTETLPDYVLREKGLVPLNFALKNIHFPQDQNALAKAEYRLKFEELFFLQLSLLRQKYVRSRNEKGIPMPNVGEAFNKCYEALPYSLTGAQKRVIREIREDMRSGRQMNRLLQGDVGSGKTMVAVLSALIAYGNGYQSCIMAPTEVLARQHYTNIIKYLCGTGVEVAVLTGTTKARERKEILERLASGQVGIIVGTHALIEDNVIFRNLGLAIIDEQHRFGVEQRSRLWAKSTIPPHILVMTATPIPRTLAMTLYGDLDVSVIDEMPPGRVPVKTLQIVERQRLELYRFIKDQIAAGRQAFIVYPMIFENEKVDYRNVETGYEEIVSAFPFPPYKVAIVHGQQSDEDKKFNMDAFVAGRANILVSTTVIEVGVDVPNANVMVIESPERFGLSQLHQLRGRVGRGGGASWCVLVRGNKLSEESRKRLDLLCSTEDGFVLAEEDMKMRGPGDMEGTQQSGLPIELSIASLAKDGRLLSEARAYAEIVLERDPELASPQNARLLKELRKGKYDRKDYGKIS
ncbi:MAG: ATP-dependent DNA helicase RecG [Candidatus Cryptobacteroides sp.]